MCNYKYLIILSDYSRYEIVGHTFDLAEATKKAECMFECWKELQNVEIINYDGLVFCNVTLWEVHLEAREMYIVMIGGRARFRVLIARTEEPE